MFLVPAKIYAKNCLSDWILNETFPFEDRAVYLGTCVYFLLFYKPVSNLGAKKKVENRIFIEGKMVVIQNIDEGIFRNWFYLLDLQRPL